MDKTQEAILLIKRSTEPFSNLEKQFKIGKSQYSPPANLPSKKVQLVSAIDVLKLLDKISILLGCEILSYILNKKEHRLEMVDINKNAKVAISLFILEQSIHILYNRDTCITKFSYILDLTMNQDLGLLLPKWVLLSHTNEFKISPQFKQIYGKNISERNKSESKLIVSKLFEAIIELKGIFKEKHKSASTINRKLNEYLKKLGKKVLEKREALGLSREELAAKIKLSRMHIYRIEDGENKTNILILRRISKVFEMDLGELVNIS